MDHHNNVKYSSLIKGQQQAFTNVLCTVFATVLLGACSGASDTLAVSSSISQNSDGTFNYLNCTGSDCVKTELTLEPIRNMNYSCSTVNSVTGVDSVTACPANSDMSVFLQYPNGKRKIELGSLKIEAVSKNANVGNFLQRVSPVTLADPSATSLDEATRAINIVRLLDALGDRNTPYNDLAPVNQINIPDSYKQNMDEMLQSDVVLDDFKDDTFITKTQDWLKSHGKSVTLSYDDAKKRLERSLTVLNAGMYYQVPTLTGTSIGTEQQLSFNNGISITGKLNTGDQSVNMSIFALANREGATVGQGMHWQGKADTSTSQFNLFRDERFKRMRIINPTQAKFENITNKISGYQWRVAKVNQDNGEQTDAEIEIDLSPSNNQGVLLRNFVMIGTNSLFKTYFGKTNSDSSTLGRWTQTSTANGARNEEVSVKDDNSATIIKFTPSQLSTFFDPAVWRSESVVAANVKQNAQNNKNYVFPLHATLTFTYGQGNTNRLFKDSTGQDCQKDGCNFKQGKLGITILENGDIITDGSDTVEEGFVLGKPSCESATLISSKYTDSSNYSEKRIGTVRATSQSVLGNTGFFINPSIMLSGEEFGELDGIHLGTRVAASNVAINLAGVINAAVNTKGSVNINDTRLIKKDEKTLANATWNNPYHFFTLLNITREQESNSAYSLTDYEQAAVNQQLGQVSISVSDCYKVKQVS